MSTLSKRFVVVSNRLPISIDRDESGQLIASQGAGGLVTALAPVLKNRGGTWIGWPGISHPDTNNMCLNFSKKAGYDLEPVHLTDAEIDGFYLGFSNEILWPLFHEFQMPCNFNPTYWDDYYSANKKFADVILNKTSSDDFIWVHDYHLILLAKILKAANPKLRVGFFLHIPFPPADIFFKIPWRKELIDAFMDFDLIGFQTSRDRRNFLEVSKRIYRNGVQKGRGQLIHFKTGDRDIRVGYFPIGIDYNFFAKVGKSTECQQSAHDIREAFGNRFLLFGADRLDYTKGIPQRLDAISMTLEKYPDLREKISLIQVLVPSREDVPQYKIMKEEIERKVGEINGKYSTPGWTPIHFFYRNLDARQLIAYYNAADMALITPLRDGMNLVAKEFVASKVNETGILCLSEFAGAAMELHRYASIVNPFSLNGVADAIYEGIHMSPHQIKRKMRLMRSIVKRYDIYWWVDSFLTAAFSINLNDFPSNNELVQLLGGDESQIWGTIIG